MASISIVRRTITEAIKWLHQVQKPDGGWVGSWGICFTYATQFALESLALGGEYYANSPAVRRACDFLLSKQREDGGWGESYKVSCLCCSYLRDANSYLCSLCSVCRLANSVAGLNMRILRLCRRAGQPWLSCTPGIPMRNPSRRRSI